MSNPNRDNPEVPTHIVATLAKSTNLHDVADALHSMAGDEDDPIIALGIAKAMQYVRILAAEEDRTFVQHMKDWLRSVEGEHNE